MTISGARRSVRLRCQFEADPEEIVECRFDLGVGVEHLLLSIVGPGADQAIATERDATGLGWKGADRVTREVRVWRRLVEGAHRREILEHIVASV